MKTNRIFKMMKLSSLSIYETADTRHSLNKFALCSRLTTVFIFALSSFIFISCSQDEVLEQDLMKDTPLTIASAGVAELTTRAITEGQLIGSVDENVSISVWVEGSADKYNANNVEWVHNGTDWYSNSTVLYEGENKQKICALSPYVENASAAGVTITADGTTDYLVASQTSITSNPVNICMSHALAKLVLNPTLGTELEGETITEVKVVNMYASGTLNVSDNSWSNLGEAESSLVMRNNEILVIPMEGCESFPIVITMESGRVFSANISLANVDNKLEGGTKYTIKLQIGQDKVTLGGVTADSWGVPVDGGDLETM